MNDDAGVGDAGLPTAENENGFSAKTVVLASAGGVVAAFVLSWAYGPAEHYSPIIYLNLLLAYGMGWLVGKCCQAILRRKKINRLGPARLVGVVSVLAAAWFSWLAYIWVIISSFSY